MINHTIQLRNVKRFVNFNHPDGVKESYFVLIIDTEKPPWVLTRYRYNQNLIKGLTSPGLFDPPKRHRLVIWYRSRHHNYVDRNVPRPAKAG
jgi:hypothetical protein